MNEDPAAPWSSRMPRSYHALFSQAVFRGDPLPEDWPADFIIITAYDPEGRSVSPATNAAADQALALELRGAGHRLHRISGESPDGRHREPGWALAIGLSEAIKYGRKYRQLGVFQIRAGRLFLVDCGDGSATALDRAFSVARAF